MNQRWAFVLKDKSLEVLGPILAFDSCSVFPMHVALIDVSMINRFFGNRQTDSSFLGLGFRIESQSPEKLHNRGIIIISVRRFGSS